MCTITQNQRVRHPRSVLLVLLCIDGLAELQEHMRNNCIVSTDNKTLNPFFLTNCIHFFILEILQPHVRKQTLNNSFKNCLMENPCPLTTQEVN